MTTMLWQHYRQTQTRKPLLIGSRQSLHTPWDHCFQKSGIDLNSIQEDGNGGIAAWERETYEKNQDISPDYSVRIGEALYQFDCTNGTFTILHSNTQKANGDLARSTPMPEVGQKNRETLVPKSRIGAEAKLACDQAKKIGQTTRTMTFI
jgi:hypothetical protein